MQHTNTIPFDGDTGRAFDLAMSSLTSLGFRVVSRDETRMEMAGPGMNSSRQSALLGASRLRLTRGIQELSVQAELGGVETMARFVTLFPIVLVLGLGIIFVLLAAVQQGGQMPSRASLVPVIAAVAPNAALWLILGPWMARRIGRKTREALDALLNNMAVAGRSA